MEQITLKLLVAPQDKSGDRSDYFLYDLFFLDDSRIAKQYNTRVEHINQKPPCFQSTVQNVFSESLNHRFKNQNFTSRRTESFQLSRLHPPLFSCSSSLALSNLPSLLLIYKKSSISHFQISPPPIQRTIQYPAYEQIHFSPTPPDGDDTKNFEQ